MASRNGPVEVTREEYNEVYGAEAPEFPEIPFGLEQIWRWFWTLNGRRQSGMDGVNPLTYSEIESWQRMTATMLIPEEVEMLVQMDDAYLSQVTIEMKDRREREEQERKQSGR